MVGPTASGKSALALAWAGWAQDVEIVSVDSMQVYRGMDIGTASPTEADRDLVPHHLVDLVDAHEDFTVADHQAAARAAIADIEARGRRALLVGGTALHLRAIVDDLVLPGRFPAVRAEIEAEPDTARLYALLVDADPVAAARMEPTNRRRVVRALEVTTGAGRPFSSFGAGLDRHPPTPFRLVGLWLPREEVRRRIAVRFRTQMDRGFVDEVRALAGSADGIGRTAAQALGYRELLDHLEGLAPLDEARDRAIARAQRFARRQRMWFRRDPRVRWLAVARDPQALESVDAFLDPPRHEP